MDTNILLNKIATELKQKNIANDLILFGSAVSSKIFDDLDLLLYLEKDFFSPSRLLKLIEAMFFLENKYSKYLTFSYSSGKVRRKDKNLIKISICPDHSYSNDEILEYSISINNKTLFGENPYKNYLKPKGEYFLSILNRHYKNQELSYKVLKQYLFLGLLYLRIYEKKENLLKRFALEYSSNIFNGEEDVFNFLELEEKILKEKFNEIYQIIYNKIVSNEPNSKNKKLRDYSRIENFFFQIHSKLMKMWANDSFVEVKRFLEKMQLEFEDEFQSFQNKTGA